MSPSRKRIGKARRLKLDNIRLRKAGTVLAMAARAANQAGISIKELAANIKRVQQCGIKLCN